jgi:hypothetical protein
MAQKKKTTSQSPSKTDSKVSDATAGGPERRRLPRILLATEQFRLSINGKLFSVADLAPQGMALRLLDQTDFSLFPVGNHIEGILNLRREKYPVKAKVIHLGRDLVGCRFENLDETVKYALKKELDPGLLGQDMKPFPIAEKGASWYRGTSGTDLMMWRDDHGSCRKFVLLVLGNYIQWEHSENLRTGQVRASSDLPEEHGVLELETLLLVADPQADPAKLKVAKSLIMGSNLPVELKNWFSGVING